MPDEQFWYFFSKSTILSNWPELNTDTPWLEHDLSLYLNGIWKQKQKQNHSSLGVDLI